ncbi:alginate export family protein [Chryseolinea lacunae]|uniref:Alginate export family protein n=1 Tax=Chryseolinea lacunae TaxID=2801331 RepID=A0ABS1KZC2_9BACT|nr:alginate export family protein [Chryseolinea lacunae]MBL0744774.1 alginate export family protein [Chryseolinea lacunae]
MKNQYRIYFLVACGLFVTSGLHAQLTISGQLRTRTEVRDGQGSPSVRDTVPAVFTSQRTRINIGYAGYRFKVYASLQDVRVWGQDASTINRTTTDAYDGFMVHEAWGEISLVDTGKVVKNFSLKIGRQELVYDDVRLLGNLDWLQQARRHDAALLKFEHNGWTAHLGAAFNQNAERKSNTAYNGIPTGYTAGTNGIGAMYKSMQFLYAAKKLKFGTISALAFKDDFSKFHFAPTDTDKKTPIYDQGVWSRFTVGSHFVGTALKKIALTADGFYQGGHYREGTSLDEYFLSLSALYAVTPKFSVGPGVDLTSGNNGSDPAAKYQRFDPLYGTPHKFWGYMDYFYVADGFGPSGLLDTYVKSRYKVKDNFTLTLDVHRFALPHAVTDESGVLLSKTLGTEVDFTFNYALTKIITIEGGYSFTASTQTLSSVHVKNIKNADRFSQWGYVMLAIRPEAVLGGKLK